MPRFAVIVVTGCLLEEAEEERVWIGFDGDNNK